MGRAGGSSTTSVSGFTTCTICFAEAGGRMAWSARWSSSWMRIFRPEFEKLVDQMVADASVADSRTRPIYQSAFEQLNRLPIPAWHLFFRHPDHVPDSMKGTTWEAMNLLDEGSAHLERGDLDQALEALEALLRRFKAGR